LKIEEREQSLSNSISNSGTENKDDSQLIIEAHAQTVAIL